MEIVDKTSTKYIVYKVWVKVYLRHELMIRWGLEEGLGLGGGGGEGMADTKTKPRRSNPV